MNVNSLEVSFLNSQSSLPLMASMSGTCNIKNVEYFILTTAMITTASLFTTLSAVLMLSTAYHSNIDYAQGILKSIDPQVMNQPVEQRIAFITYVKHLVSFKGIYDFNKRLELLEEEVEMKNKEIE